MPQDWWPCQYARIGSPSQGVLTRSGFSPGGRALYPVRVALLAAAYFGAARPGLTRAFVAERGTVVWPPAGIAPADLLWRREHFGK